MADVTWHYLENQFDAQTKQSRRLMNAILIDHHDKLAAALPGNGALAPVVANLAPAYTAWQQKYGAWKNARAAYRSASQAVENLFAQLQEEPVGGGRSKLDAWVSQIAAHWGANDPVYDFLLPQGREPFTSGSLDDIVGEVQRLGQRLATKGAEIGAFLATAEGQALPVEEQDALAAAQTMCVETGSRVTAFHGQLVAARALQTGKEGLVDQLAGQVEPARKVAARALLKDVYLLGAIFIDNDQLAQVAGFYDLALIMQPPAEDDEAEEPGEGGSSSSASSSSSSGGPP